MKPGQGGVGYPECLRCPNPGYSAEAHARNFQGKVVLQVVITPEGRATDIKVLKATGMGLDEKAIEAVRKWTFKPAMGPGGRPVPVRVTVEVAFRLLP